MSFYHKMDQLLGICPTLALPLNIECCLTWKACWTTMVVGLICDVYVPRKISPLRHCMYRWGEVGQTGWIGTDRVNRDIWPHPQEKQIQRPLWFLTVQGVPNHPICPNSPLLSQFTPSVPIKDFATDSVVYTALFSYWLLELWISWFSLAHHG